MAIDDDRLDTTEGGDLIQKVDDYMTAHPQSTFADWPRKGRSRDVLDEVVEEMLEVDGVVSRPNLYAARCAIAVWMDDNGNGRPAGYQLQQFLDAWNSA